MYINISERAKKGNFFIGSIFRVGIGVKHATIKFQGIHGVLPNIGGQIGVLKQTNQALWWLFMDLSNFSYGVPRTSWVVFKMTWVSLDCSLSTQFYSLDKLYLIELSSNLG